MNNEEAFLAWAPPEVSWSDWAKPVAFAQAPPSGAMEVGAPPRSASPLGVSPPGDWQALPLDWLPAPGDVAIVVDLPGTLSVTHGLAMARRGYRPVPLYNACTGLAEIVRMQLIIQALLEGAQELSRMNISPQAPPAFLLDAERLQGGNAAQPGRFDNRWMVFPQDFPSANKLLSKQIRRAILVQNGPPVVPDDLAHVLLRWQDARLELMAQDAQSAGPPQPLQVRPPKRFKSIWYRLLAMAGLRRNSAGGFGSIVPQVASGVGIG